MSRARLLVAAATTVAAAAVAPMHDYLPCAPASMPPSPSNDTAYVINPGGNPIILYACNAATPTPATCAPGGAPSVIAACGIALAPNTSTYIRVDVAATALIAQYQSISPFSWHPLTSSPPLLISWPVGDSILIPYPSNDTVLCDIAADCGRSDPCISAPAPPRCQYATPSPGPAPASPLPVPSPSPLPAAASCNLTGPWEQPHAAVAVAAAASGSRLRHSADAFITIDANGTFYCTSSKALCPGAASAWNGTIVQDGAGQGVELRPFGGGPVVTGFINSTFSCATITLASATPPVVWNSIAPAPPPQFNTNVTAATFLGAGAGGADGGRQFVASGVAIVSAPAGSAALIVIAGNGQAAWAGITPTAILGASTTSNGTLLLVRTAAGGGVGSGVTAVAAVKVGDRIDHVRANAAGDIAIAGSFGLAVLRGMASGSPAVVWSDSLADVEPGSCGICCTVANANSNTTCRVDIGDDGVVALNLAVTAADGALWAVYSASGVRFAWGSQPNAASLDAVAVDGSRSRFYVGYFYNSYTGQEPMVMPRVDVYGYDAGTGAYALQFAELPWDARVYRTAGQPCYGDVADGRVMGVRIGRDDTMLFMGRSDGGDSPYYCGLRNSTRSTPLAVIDGYNTPYNMQAQAITNMLRVDASSGEVIVGQIQLVRLANTQGNTLITVAAQSDTAGVVYELQNAACCLPNMANLTINGQPLAGPTDATALHIVSPNMEVRHTWTHFIAAGSGGSTTAIDIDVRGEVVAAIMLSAAEMVTAGALPGTSGNVGGAAVGYLVVLPTVASPGSTAA